MTSSTASTSSSKYKLYWYDVSFGQYVFEASDTSEASEASGGLARVSSVQDLLEHLELLSGDKEMPTKLTVGGLALLGGNLIAQSQFKDTHRDALCDTLSQPLVLVLFVAMPFLRKATKQQFKSVSPGAASFCAAVFGPGCLRDGRELDGVRGKVGHCGTGRLLGESCL